MRPLIVPLVLILVAPCVPALAHPVQDAKIVVVDMERAVVGSTEGKKAEAAFTAKLESLRKNIETKQKDLESQQTKLRTQERLLSDVMKADIAKDIERRQTELTRIQEDAQKELDSLRGELMRPIAQVAELVLNVFAREQGFTLIIDTSNPENGSIVFANPKADITDEIIKRINTEMAKAPAAAPKKPGQN